MHTGAYSAETSEWKVWSSNFDEKGYGYSLQLKNQRTITENLGDNILILHPDIQQTKKKKEINSKSFARNLKIVPVGFWNNFEVFDVYHHSLNIKEIIIKKGSNDYRIIYSLYPISKSDIKPTVRRGVRS